MTTKEAVVNLAKMINKEPDELQKDVLPFPDNREVARFKNKNYEVSVSIWVESSEICPIVQVLDPSVGPSFIQVDNLDPSWLDSINQRSRPEFCTAPNNKLEVSEATTAHLCTCEARTHVSFGPLGELAVPLLLRATCIKKLIKSIRLAGWDIAFHHPSRRFQY